ncbi:nucleotidyltransferase domain-containing protein [Paenibacillus macerans]|uniref:nucleotidyltransferase domain-containing protein n=1 Tax=Paenibacillus macerans TaxID=44252 RepID=UPI00203C820D|nr:nucleotidyltransferase domain-containing protein [Paenibacillus macerans]MCM3701469.1 nucleotidyltransferase domain-containing protein [Paenibacillus macerans]
MNPMRMFDHHKQTLDNFIEKWKSDSSCLAIMIGGSIAHGTAKETSDVDVYLLMTEEAYEIRRSDRQLSFADHSVSAYEGGYVDVKVISLSFLELAAKEGSEPTRHSFVGSKAVYSTITGLDELLSRIPVYPEENREKNLRDFSAQLYLHAFYFAKEAGKKDDPYLMAHAVSNLVLFSSRIILAVNRILFSGHKSLMEAVEAAPQKPKNFRKLAIELLRQPSAEKCARFATMMLVFYNPGLSFDQALGIYVENNERNWVNQAPPLQDR